MRLQISALEERGERSVKVRVVKPVLPMGGESSASRSWGASVAGVGVGVVASGGVGGVEEFGALVAVEAGFEGGVVFGAGLVVFLEVEELAEEGLGAGEEAAVVVPESGQGCGLVFEEVEGGEV